MGFVYLDPYGSLCYCWIDLSIDNHILVDPDRTFRHTHIYVYIYILLHIQTHICIHICICIHIYIIVDPDTTYRQASPG